MEIKSVCSICIFFKLDAAKVLQCNQSKKQRKLTMKFQEFSPNPTGFIFYPEESYYLMGKWFTNCCK